MPLKGYDVKKSPLANLSIMLPLAAVALLILGWSIFWYIGSRKAEATLTAWMEREAQAGRKWICPDQRIGGYPFEIEISCSRPAFRGEILGKTYTGTLRGFRAASPLMRPESVVAEMDAPFVVKTNDGTVDFNLQWSNLGLELEGRPTPLSRLSLIGEQVALQGTIDGMNALAGSAGIFHAYVVPTPDSRGQTYDFLLALSQASFPDLERLLNLSAPITATFAGAITQTDFAGATNLDERIEQWRAAGGRINLKTARLTSGATKFDAHGSLDLDDGHRPRGKLDAAIAGLEPALSRLGVDPALLKAGSLLTSALGSRAQGETDSATGVTAPLTIADGWLSIGPIRTPVRFSPLY